MDASAAIDVRGLVKTYGDIRAVDGIDLRIERGEIFALLGPNGAGKTTTVEILEGYRSRDAGSVSVLGCDPATQRRQLKPRIGIVLQSTGVDRFLTVAETVVMYAGYYPDPRPCDEVIARRWPHVRPARALPAARRRRSGRRCNRRQGAAACGPGRHDGARRRDRPRSR